MTITTIKNCNYLPEDSTEFVHGSVHIVDDLIAGTDAEPEETVSRTIDACGNLVIPGLIDCYARLREPGYENQRPLQVKQGRPRTPESRQFFAHRIPTR